MSGREAISDTTSRAGKSPDAACCSPCAADGASAAVNAATPDDVVALRRRFSLLERHDGTAFLVFDRDGRIREANARAQRALGLDPAPSVTTPLRDIAAPGQPVDYVVTGHWGRTALDQVRHCVDLRIAASSEADGFRDIPQRATWTLSPD